MQIDEYAKSSPIPKRILRYMNRIDLIEGPLHLLGRTKTPGDRHPESPWRESVGYSFAIQQGFFKRGWRVFPGGLSRRDDCD